MQSYDRFNEFVRDFGAIGGGSILETIKPILPIRVLCVTSEGFQKMKDDGSSNSTVLELQFPWSRSLKITYVKVKGFKQAVFRLRLVLGRAIDSFTHSISMDDGVFDCFGDEHIHVWNDWAHEETIETLRGKFNWFEFILFCINGVTYGYEISEPLHEFMKVPKMNPIDFIN
jgi:hypothetical protein